MVKGSRELANLFTPVRKSKIDHPVSLLKESLVDYQLQQNSLKPLRIKFPPRCEKEDAFVSHFAMYFFTVC